MEADMELTLIFLTGTAIGVLIGLFWATSKSRSEFSCFMVQAEASLKVAEATSVALFNKEAELRRGLNARAQELAQVQEQSRVASEQLAVAQSELKRTKASLDELSSVRDRLNAESQLRIAVETKLKESEINLSEQKKLVDEATARLSDMPNRGRA
jgi:hypothetical protein